MSPENCKCICYQNNNTMKIITKILCAAVFFALIGFFVNAQPVTLTGNETSYAAVIVEDYINSSELNLTDYTLRIVPRAVPLNGTKMVNVFLLPENSTKWTIKFRVDLNSGVVVKEFLKKDTGFFGKSKQNKTGIKEILKIANNDSGIKEQFLMLNFTKILHIQSHGKIKSHVIFVPADAYEKSGTGLEKKHNLTIVNVNISIEDKKVLKFEIKENKKLMKDNQTAGNPDFAGNTGNAKGKNK